MLSHLIVVYYPRSARFGAPFHAVTLMRAQKKAAENNGLIIEKRAHKRKRLHCFRRKRAFECFKACSNRVRTLTSVNNFNFLCRLNACLFTRLPLKLWEHLKYNPVHGLFLSTSKQFPADCSIDLWAVVFLWMGRVMNRRRNRAALIPQMRCERAHFAPSSARALDNIRAFVIYKRFIEMGCGGVYIRGVRLMMTIDGHLMTPGTPSDAG